MKKPIFFVIALFIFTALACSFNLSTAQISDAKIAKDPEGNQPTTNFGQDEPFYCVVTLANAPDDTKVKAVWSVVEAQDTEPNLKVDEVELTSGDGMLHFDLTNDKLWPVGKYKVELFLNDKLDRTLEFQVEASAVAEEPTPTPEPTATPEPTPTPEPTEEATVEPTEEGSESDSLSLDSATAEPTEEASQYEPLPFKDEPYQHPSGAFTFALPESFEGIAGDATSVSFGDDRSVVGAAFTDAGAEYSDKEMNDFIKAFTDSFMANFVDDYKVLEQKTTSDGSIFEAVSFESPDGNGDADFIFEQRDTVVFVLYFVTFAYEEMEPTWHKIIESYSVDPDAALTAAPTAAPTPAPKPTQPPAPAGPSAPAGKGLFIFNNNTGVDFVIDVIGPTNDSKVIPPNSSQQFVLDPGHYTINGHSPGGDYYIDAYSFDIAAGEVFPLNLN